LCNYSIEKTKAKYINTLTDFGFEKIFGEEVSKPLLIEFLNVLLLQTNKIVTLVLKTQNILVKRKQTGKRFG